MSIISEQSEVLKIYAKIRDINKRLRENPTAALDDLLDFTGQRGYINFSSSYSFLKNLKLLIEDREMAKIDIKNLIDIGAKVQLLGMNRQTVFYDLPVYKWIITEGTEPLDLIARVGKEDFLHSAIEDDCLVFIEINGAKLPYAVNDKLKRSLNIQIKEELTYEVYEGLLKDIDNFYQTSDGNMIATLNIDIIDS